MPYYSFQNKRTGEIKDIYFKINDKKEYIDGIDFWVRLFSVPNMSVDTKINPFSCEEFKNKTRNKKGMTLGQAWDESKCLSEKRKQIAGHDPIKEKEVAAYEKKCHGIPHPLKNQ